MLWSSEAFGFCPQLFVCSPDLTGKRACGGTFPHALVEPPPPPSRVLLDNSASPGGGGG